MQKKALLAIAVANGMLNSQLPSLSQNDLATNNNALVVQQIVNDKETPPENKAYTLLYLADAYIDNRARSTIEEEFQDRQTALRIGFTHRRPRGEDILVAWSKKLSREAHSPETSTNKNDETKSVLPELRDENRTLADKALKGALTQLGQSSQKFSQLNMYLIALRLFDKVGDSDSSAQCMSILENAFKSGEHASAKEENDTLLVLSASTVLNSMAYGLVPIDIPDLDPKNNPRFAKQNVILASKKEIKAAERLKLRALGLADRLETWSDTRRKAHRDLALWYQEVGKTKLADEQKQVLFELVGFKSDTALYAQQSGCGQVVWWQEEPNPTIIDCGRG